MRFQTQVHAPGDLTQQSRLYLRLFNVKWSSQLLPSRRLLESWAENSPKDKARVRVGTPVINTAVRALNALQTTQQRHSWETVRRG